MKKEIELGETKMVEWEAEEDCAGESVDNVLQAN